jgi:hypothetical protein
VVARRRDTGIDQGGQEISAEDRARIAKAARQLAAYTNFLRWCANFQKDEVSRHPRSERVILLSPMQSGRFAFRVQGNTGELGVQPFELAWMSCMPFDKAYVTDRLYLSVEGVSCLDSGLTSLGIGIFIDDQAKRQTLATMASLRIVEVRVNSGKLTPADREIGAPLTVSAEDIATVLTARARLRQKDVSRFL